MTAAIIREGSNELTGNSQNEEQESETSHARSSRKQSNQRSLSTLELPGTDMLFLGQPL
ncbi:hypothetical protein [Kamptonema formosum]|uniref:hypothetical protein n=1 Tax=Kamptonema formosum TaxID=331992 RepID=UPI00034D139F|nr:hypothetical protein [Oscillatoria sp. PCC 10802]